MHDLCVIELLWPCHLIPIRATRVQNSDAPEILRAFRTSHARSSEWRQPEITIPLQWFVSPRTNVITL